MEAKENLKVAAGFALVLAIVVGIVLYVETMPDHGKVLDKGHDAPWMQWMPGRTTTNNGHTTTTPGYWIYHSEKWTLLIDSEGFEEKPRVRWVNVSEGQWLDLKVGDIWHRPGTEQQQNKK